ncbi:hypothetical protein HK101_011810, partial [Irineochytrium annulatum]
MLAVRVLIALCALFGAIEAAPRPGGGATTPATSTVATSTTAPATSKTTSSTSKTTSSTSTSTSTTSVPPPKPTGLQPKFLGRMSLTNVGFTRVVPNSDGTSDLLLSCFTGNPFSSDKGYFIPNVGSTLAKFNSTVATQIGGSITWPNEMTPVSASEFGKSGVLAAGGFLVPGHSNGGIWYSAKTGATTQSDWVPLFTNSNGYFYHRAVLMDVNADGVMDIMTCRAKKPLVGGSGSGSQVYLTANDPTKPTGAWTEHVIGSHCDTFFDVKDINGDGIPEIITAEYWGSALTVISTKDPKGSFANATNLVYNVIDAAVGHAFDVEVVDINGDGKLDLLVSNHQGTSDNPSGSVYAYEIPADITSPASAWTKHTLATGFPVLQGGQNQASPGAAHAFHPKVGASGKPSIVVAGDGSQKAYILSPNSASTSDWSYTTSVLWDCVNTVGGISFGDVNGDGITE